MDKFFIRRGDYFLSLIIIVLVLICAHYPLIWKTNFFYLDDSIVVLRIQNMNSILDVFRARQLDVQPVRDICYYILWSLQKNYNIHLFSFFNVIIWQASGLLIYLIFRVVKISNYVALIFTLLFVTSPIFVMNVAWCSDLKHLLSFFFILCSTILVLKNKSFYLILCFYILSTLSQPINALWFIWLIYFYFNLWKRGEIKKDNLVKRSLSLIFTAFFLVLINLYYYYVFGVNPNQITEIPVYDTSTILEIFLAYGRYAFNFIYPFDSAIYYKVISIENFSGLALLIAFLVWVIKEFKKFKDNIHWLLFALLPLLTVTMHKLIIFVSNTYAMTTYFGVSLFIALYFNEKSFLKIERNILIILSILTIGFFTFTSNVHSTDWKRDADVLRRSYENEDVSEIGAFYVSLSISDYFNEIGDRSENFETMNNYVEILQKIRSGVQQSRGYYRNTIFTVWNSFAIYLFSSSKLQVKDKYKIYKMVEDPEVFYSNVAMLFISQAVGKKQEAKEYLNTVLEQLRLIQIPIYPTPLYLSYLVTYEDLFARLQLAVTIMNDEENNYFEQIFQHQLRIMPNESIQRISLRFQSLKKSLTPVYSSEPVENFKLLQNLNKTMEH